MTDNDRPWLPEEAAEWFRVSVLTIRRWVAAGRLRRTAPNGALRITARSIRELSEGYDAPDGQGEGTRDDHTKLRERSVSGA